MKAFAKGEFYLTKQRRLSPRDKSRTESFVRAIDRLVVSNRVAAYDTVGQRFGFENLETSELQPAENYLVIVYISDF